MGEGESQGDDTERKPGKSAEWNGPEFFVDKISKQKSPPKNFLHQRDAIAETKESEQDRCPIRSRARSEHLRAESIRSGCDSEELLWRNPKHKNENAVHCPDKNPPFTM